MTDGKSFFRGGTESNTRLSTFIAKKTVPTLSRSTTSYQKIHGNKGGVTPSKRVNSVENQKAVSQILPPVTNGINAETPAKQADRRTDSLTHFPSVQPAGLPRLDLDFTERELTRLASFLDDSIIKVPEANKAEEPDLTTEANKPKRTFYVEKWPEPVVKLDNTIVPLKQTVSAKVTTSFGFVGGNPITIELAKELRMTVSGSTIHSLSMEWKKASFIFQNMDSPFSYGLVTPKGSGARGITLAVQAHCLQHLLYQTDTDPDDLSNLRPSGPKRRGALVRAICDMLWRAGQGVESQVCLSQPDSAFPAQPGYREDGITEKLHMFTFRSYGDLESFIKRYLDHFSRDFGCLLFLYSLVLSRGITRISDDQGQRTGGVEKLLTDMEGCSLSLVNLLVTGQAVRFLHNGLTIYDEFGHMLPTPEKGVQERCPLGFLFLDKSERCECRTQVGSMLKTPRFPIWLTMVNGMMGLLFSTNPELVRHWRVEHRFMLYYYTGQPSQQRQTCLSIDTRFNKRGRVKTALARRDTEDKAPPLETCILTKWYDAEIKWNGSTPFY